MKIAPWVLGFWFSLLLLLFCPNSGLLSDARLGRYLRLCLCGGWGCGGCGLLGQDRQWPRAARRDRGSQSLASASVMQSTTLPSGKAGLPGPWFGHPAQITARRTLSWSPRATHPPVGTFWLGEFLCCLSCCLLLV